MGSFLYYGRAVDNTILTVINEISATQAAPTKFTSKKIQMLLDYLSTYPNAKVRFYASNMKLHVDLDAAYLVAPKAQSCIAGFYYCSNNTPNPPLNGPVHVECRVLRHVVTSAAEAETAVLFYNTQTAVELLPILRALGHPQRAVPSRPTMPPPLHLSLTPLNNDVAKHGTFNTIGCQNNNVTKNSIYIGTKGLITSLIIIRNITPLVITKKWGPLTF